MSGKRSVRRGKEFERKQANWLKENLNVTARRGLQFRGVSKTNEHDIDIDMPINFECKRSNALNPYLFMEQAKKDCLEDEIPCVIMKSDRKNVLYLIEQDHLLRFCKLIAERIKDQ